MLWLAERAAIVDKAGRVDVSKIVAGEQTPRYATAIRKVLKYFCSSQYADIVFVIRPIEIQSRI